MTTDDRNDPALQPLIRFFAVHKAIEDFAKNSLPAQVARACRAVYGEAKIKDPAAPDPCLVGFSPALVGHQDRVAKLHRLSKKGFKKAPFYRELGVWKQDWYLWESGDLESKSPGLKAKIDAAIDQYPE